MSYNTQTILQKCVACIIDLYRIDYAPNARPTTGVSKNRNKLLIVTKAAMTGNIIKGTPLVLIKKKKKS